VKSHYRVLNEFLAEPFTVEDGCGTSRLLKRALVTCTCAHAQSPILGVNVIETVTDIKNATYI
jgi:hypothetical protein